MGREGKTRIYRLEQEEVVIEGEENLKKFKKKYYKRLFGKIEKNIFLWMRS